MPSRDEGRLDGLLVGSYNSEVPRTHFASFLMGWPVHSDRALFGWPIFIIALGLGCATPCPVTAQPASPRPPSPITALLRADRGIDDLLAASRNRDFLGGRLDPMHLEKLRTHLGRDVSDRLLGGSSPSSVGDLLRRSPEFFKNNPHALTFLTNLRRSSGVQVFANDQEPASLPPAGSGRIVPAPDLARRVGDEGNGDRLRSYLQNNFNLDDRQSRAYMAYLGLLGTPPEETDGDTSPDQAIKRAESKLGKVLKAAARGASRGGLYLPDAATLDQMTVLMGLVEALGQGGDPAKVRTPDGRTIAELVDEFEPDPGKRPTPEQLRSMRPAQLRKLVMALMKRLAEREREGLDRYLFELGVAWTDGPTEEARTSQPDGGGLGNGKLRELNNVLYRKLIEEEPTPTQRDTLELESMGDFFAIRGRPRDIQTKHYDPPLDPRGLLFGTGMALQNRKIDLITTP